MIDIRVGDSLTVLQQMPSESVHCCVTSPPYWGLRDYGVDGQIGLEASLGEHMAVLVTLFREVRRVLRKDGTCWVNYGDAYASAPNGRSAADTKAASNDDRTFRDKPISTVGFIHPTAGTVQDRGKRSSARWGGGNNPATGFLKPKDRMMLPARLAIALQEDGWWLRDEIVWNKPNPMPSSAKDRTTPAHEMIYLLTKSERYWFDHAAIREPVSENTHARKPGPNSRVNIDRVPVPRKKLKVPGAWDLGAGGHGTINRQGRTAATYVDAPGVGPKSADEGSLVKAKGSFHASTTDVLPDRAKRSVWTVAPRPFPEAHFATFPPSLIEPCILAGCPAGGVVLDPFFGAGTTGLVAAKHGRDCIGIELNHDYVEIARRRLGLPFGVFA